MTSTLAVQKEFGSVELGLKYLEPENTLHVHLAKCYSMPTIDRDEDFFAMITASYSNSFFLLNLS